MDRYCYSLLVVATNMAAIENRPEPNDTTLKTEGLSSYLSAGGELCIAMCLNLS